MEAKEQVKLSLICQAKCVNYFRVHNCLYFLITECHSSCRTCSGPGVYECSSCYSGHVLTHNGMCADMCYGGYYEENGVCKGKLIKLSLFLISADIK